MRDNEHFDETKYIYLVTKLIRYQSILAHLPQNSAEELEAADVEIFHLELIEQRVQVHRHEVASDEIDHYVRRVLLDTDQVADAFQIEGENVRTLITRHKALINLT